MERFFGGSSRAHCPHTLFTFPNSKMKTPCQTLFHPTSNSVYSLPSTERFVKWYPGIRYVQTPSTILNRNETPHQTPCHPVSNPYDILNLFPIASQTGHLVHVFPFKAPTYKTRHFPQQAPPTHSSRLLSRTYFSSPPPPFTPTRPYHRT